MVVYFEGEIHRIPVKQGPDGLQEFQNKIRTVSSGAELGRTLQAACCVLHI
jgi:hypothetical protein